jgi:F0F1-type ATP synthase assembly protein I
MKLNLAWFVEELLWFVAGMAVAVAVVVALDVSWVFLLVIALLGFGVGVASVIRRKPWVSD